MRKIIYSLFFVLTLCVACNKDNTDEQLKQENEQLKEALANNAKIEAVTFEGDKMILTYTNGLKLETEIPAVLKGEDGQTPQIGENGNWWIGNNDSGICASGVSPHIGKNGNWWVDDEDTGIAATGAAGIDGVGIQSILFDSETGMMTIVLTNGEETKFVITNDDRGLNAMYLEDLNGKYLVKKIMMGDVPVAEIEYNNDNQIKKIIAHNTNGYQTYKSFELEKTYENGLPTKVTEKKFSNSKYTDYQSNSHENSITKRVRFDEDKGSDFIEQNADGSYYYYKNRWKEDNQYSYYRFYAVKNYRMETEIFDNGNGTYMFYDYEDYIDFYNEDNNEYETYHIYKVYDENLVMDVYNGEEQSVKISNNSFKIFTNDNHHSSNEYKVNGNFVYKYIYTYRFDRTIKGIINIGDLLSANTSVITYNSNHKIEKVYAESEEGVMSEDYYQLTYNDKGEIVKTEQFEMINDVLVKNHKYVTYEYNEKNLLVQTVEHDDEKEKVIARVDYDEKGNPKEIFKYSGDVFYHRGNPVIDPETGLRIDNPMREEGLYSFAKFDYNYNMKNFFGHTFAGIFPELYEFNFNNAIKSVAMSNNFTAGAVEYKDFNEGGYPTTIEFIGLEAEGSYNGQLRVEYLKIEE